MGKLINIDNGGTLTDVCVFDGDDVYYAKTLTTPFDLSACFFDALRSVSKRIYGEDRVQTLLQSTDYIRYSTTQGTNALVERKGPKLGLLLDAGSSAADLGSGDAAGALLDSLVAGRIESLPGVMGGEGPGANELVALVGRLVNAGASRVVVALDGDDFARRERALRGVLLRHFPRHLLGSTPFLLSHELTQDRDLSRRAWSGLLNAFLHPSMERFLYTAENRLRGFRTRNPLQIFRNDGGASRVAKTVALKTYSSGPRGGLQGTAALARRYGIERLVMLDVGGTTTDVALVAHGRIAERLRGTIEGIATSFPLSDVRSAGIGGSSVFRVSHGRIVVGPESVGASPGPACFGFGGMEATITDALLALGLLDAETFFDGSLQLDVKRARAAVTRNVGEPLGLGLEAACTRMREAYLDAMADAVRAVLPAENGGATIVAFGGAGPLSACGVAVRLGISRVVVPKTAAVFSAFGIGFSDVTQSYDAAVTATDPGGLAPIVEGLRLRARRDMFGEGIDLDSCELRWHIVVERVGAEDEIELDEHLLPKRNVPEGRASLRLVASKRVAARPPERRATVEAHRAAMPAGTRAFVGDARGSAAWPVYRLDRLSVGEAADGPCIVEDTYFTFDIPRRWRATVSSAGDLLLERA